MKKIILLFMATCLSLVFIAHPVFAKCPEGSVPVSVLDSGGEIVTWTEGEKCAKDEKAGSGVIYIINFASYLRI